MSILLLIGNGFTIDFRTRVMGSPADLDTRSPLSWSFPVKAAGGANAFDVLAELREGITHVKNTNPHLNDFEIIREIGGISAARPQYAPLVDLVKATKGRWTGRLNRSNRFQPEAPLDIVGQIMRYELRLYLNAAFVHFHDACSIFDPAHWHWFSWLSARAARLGLICSFNYDLVAEWVLARASKRELEYLIDGRPRSGRIDIFKPHGSINFEVSQRAIMYKGNVFEGGNIFERNDVPVEVIDLTRLHDSRLVPDIVLPLEYSQIARFQSVACGYRHIAAMASSFDHCVIAGLSYWEHDRAEIDQILSTLATSTIVTVVNPNPNPDFIDFLKLKFSDVRLSDFLPAHV